LPAPLMRHGLRLIRSSSTAAFRMALRGRYALATAVLLVLTKPLDV
jgi:hypothetical protein